VRGEGLNKQLARNLRKNSSDAERLLWFYLRDRRLNNLKFRRQYTIGPYIVDFVSIELRLIIEVDGGQHAEMIAEDTRRTAFLNNQGYRVLRFWNNQVLTETESVLDTILSHILE
jgi:very-short-patch-repair endonuclease